MRVQHGRRAEQDDGEERVLGHLQEHVHGPDRVRHPPRRGVDRDGRPPEQQAHAEIERVLQVVGQRILERQVEQRREVGRPHDGGEGDPGDDRERGHAHRPANAGPAGSSGGACRSRQPKEQRDRRGQGEERGRHEGQQDVLDHVDREQRRVVALDAGQQRERDRGHAEPERHGPPSGHGIARVRRVHPAHRPAPPHDGDEDAERRQRWERPAEEERGQGRGLGRRRTVCRHGTGEGGEAGGATRAPARPRRAAAVANRSTRARDRGGRGSADLVIARIVPQARETPTLRVSWPRSDPQGGPTATCSRRRAWFTGVTPSIRRGTEWRDHPGQAAPPPR